MRASTTPTFDPAPGPGSPPTITLLDLVDALIDTGASDPQVVAAVAHLLEAGRVRRVGSLARTGHHRSR